MSITDELREYALGWEERNRVRSDLTAIADRIDAEHEMATSEFWAKINAVPVTEENMAERGWIRLPEDAGGEYIHAGDKLDGYGKTIEVVELRYGRSGWVLISRDGNGYADTFAFTHHHAPTVEDVLREMLDAWGELPSNVTNEAIVAEYASKLRLREDA